MFETISIKNALKQVRDGQAVFFDVRERSAFEKGHLPDALWVQPKEAEKIAQAYPGKLKIIYCDFGNYSLMLVRELWEAGYDHVASLVGGYQSYLALLRTEKNHMSIMEVCEEGLFQRGEDE